MSIKSSITLHLSSILVCISTYKYNTTHFVLQPTFLIPLCRISLFWTCRFENLEPAERHICPLGFSCDSSDPSERLAASSCSSSPSWSSGVITLFWSPFTFSLVMNSLLASAPSFLGHSRFDNRRCSKRSMRQKTNKGTITTKFNSCDIYLTQLVLQRFFHVSPVLLLGKTMQTTTKFVSLTNKVLCYIINSVLHLQERWASSGGSAGRSSVVRVDWHSSTSLVPPGIKKSNKTFSRFS